MVLREGGKFPRVPRDVQVINAHASMISHAAGNSGSVISEEQNLKEANGIFISFDGKLENFVNERQQVKHDSPISVEGDKKSEFLLVRSKNRTPNFHILIMILGKVGLILVMNKIEMQNH